MTRTTDPGGKSTIPTTAPGTGSDYSTRHRLRLKVRYRYDTHFLRHTIRLALT